jgi:hypothetical protein
VVVHLESSIYQAISSVMVDGATKPIDADNRLGGVGFG